MTLIDKHFTRRNLLVLGGCLTLTGFAYVSGKIIKKISRTHIADMPDELAMLMNIALRRQKLPNQTLVVKNARFDEGLADFDCENTEFVDCDFDSDFGINIKNLDNVKFEKCDFNASILRSGVWNNVTFDHCTAHGEFLILPKPGSRQVVFNDCDFSGPARPNDSTDQNNLGIVGSHGDALFNNCTLKYLNVVGEDGLTIKNSKLTFIDSSLMRKGGSLDLENVHITAFMDFTKSEFSSIKIVKTKFDYIDMENVRCDSFLAEDTSGHFFAEYIHAKEMTIRNSVFTADGNPLDPWDNLRAGLCMAACDVGKLTIDNIRFNGSNGILYLGGTQNMLYKKDDPTFRDPFETSNIGEITINKTELKGAYLGHLHSNQLTIKNCTVSNSYFTDSQFQQVDFSNVTLAGKIDFGNATVGKYRHDQVVRKPGLAIEKDINHLVDG